MPRTRDHNAARGSKTWGRVSGVTIESNPSGTTMVKSGVTATVVYGTTVKAGTILVGDAIKNANETGYVLPYQTVTGKGMVTGNIANNIANGVTKVEASYFGFTVVNFCMATVGSTNVQGGVTTVMVKVTTSSSSLFPTAGVSRVYFRFYNSIDGLVFKKPASAQYFAIGA